MSQSCIAPILASGAGQRCKICPKSHGHKSAAHSPMFFLMKSVDNPQRLLIPSSSVTMVYKQWLKVKSWSSGSLLPDGHISPTPVSFLTALCKTSAPYRQHVCHLAYMTFTLVIHIAQCKTTSSQPNGATLHSGQSIPIIYSAKKWKIVIEFCFLFAHIWESCEATNRYSIIRLL